MKRFALYLGIVAAMVASCSIQEEDFKVSRQDDEIFFASFERPSEETRVYANEDLLLRWTADDRVSIFNKNTYNQEYGFIGETGDYEGGFNKMGDPEFITGKEIPHVISVYPYQRLTRVTEDETVHVSLPSVQSYAENSFGLGANTMVSVSSGNLLYYKNVGGYLMLKLYGDGVSVSSITLKGNNGEILAGEASVTMPIDGDPSVEMASDATTGITLTCETPVELGATAEESKQFWFVVPPVTFSKGFTVSVSKTSGVVFEKSTSKSITIGRNTLSKMSPMEVSPALVPVPDAVDLGLPSGLKWASFDLGATKPEEYGDYFAWGDIEPYYLVGSGHSQSPVWNEGKYGYFWQDYKWCNGGSSSLTKYNVDDSHGTVDNKTIMEMEDDAAHVNLGDNWRVPTHEEWLELRDNCTWTWTTLNGVDGHLVTGNKEGFTDKWIFLPVAGYWDGPELLGIGRYSCYWSSSLGSDGTQWAWIVLLQTGRVSVFSLGRFYGLTVRPVYGDFKSVESVSMNKTSLSLLVGSTEQLSVSISPGNATEKTLTWKSSATSVATVSSEGKVTAISTGTATITAWASDGEHYTTCKVTVREPASSPDAVDLGLPSGLKWASFNLGATKPEEYGDYYAWGETEPYYSSLDPLMWKDGMESGYDWSSYRWSFGNGDKITKYCPISSYGYNGYYDDKTVLDLEDDAAHVQLGGNWRMPTHEEWIELSNNCTMTWTNQDGVNGYLVTSTVYGFTDQSIFLPAAGEMIWDGGIFSRDEYVTLWSSSLKSDNPVYAQDVALNSFETLWSDCYDRYYGRSIRPVCD